MSENFFKKKQKTNRMRMVLLLFQQTVFVEHYDILITQGFPGSSAGKESTCKAGDPGLIPGLGRSPGDRTGYPPQYPWTSLVAQMPKNLPAMWETWD